MKKRTAIILAAVLTLALVLGACSAKYYSSNNNTASSDMSWSGEANTNGSGTDSFEPSDAGEEWSEGDWDGVMDSVSGAVDSAPSPTEKMIYTADVQIETVDFDSAVETLEAMLDRYGAFLESSSVSGKSYSDTWYGHQTYRRANFTIRVPVESFREMRDGMEEVGNVTDKYTSAQNITVQYYDTESRAQTYRIEQERLMAMLEKCETVGEMIEIESRLSEVRYQLESLESSLRNMQNQVDYSTINVTLREVEKYSEPVVIHRTYWQQIGDGLSDTMDGIGSFFKETFKWFVVNLPVIVLLAAVAAVLVVIIARVSKTRRAKRAARSAEAKEDDNGK